MFRSVAPAKVGHFVKNGCSCRSLLPFCLFGLLPFEVRLLLSTHFGKMHFSFCCLAAFAVLVHAHGDHDHEQQPIAGPHQSLWYRSMRAIPGDGGTQVGGISSSQGGRDIMLNWLDRRILSSVAFPPLDAYPTIHALWTPPRNLTLHFWVRFL